MTIVFQGHIEGVDALAPIGKVAVRLRTPMAEAGGQELTIFVPKETAGHWLPGSAVNFTIYALPFEQAQTKAGTP